MVGYGILNDLAGNGKDEESPKSGFGGSTAEISRHLTTLAGKTIDGGTNRLVGRSPITEAPIRKT
jgi:hypothetical protein